MSSTKQIPWPRVIAEGAVIVVSILLAFGIDAWWEGKQERTEEGRYITALLDEAHAAADELEIDRQARDGRLAALDSLQVYFVSGRGRPDAFTSWVNESASLANFFPPTAAYDDLVSSGGLQLLRKDPEIRSDSIVGESGAGAVALMDVTRIDVKESSTGKTLLLMLLLVGIGYGGFCADYPESC